jgi:hypothetical protein
MHESKKHEKNSNHTNRADGKPDEAHCQRTQSDFTDHIHRFYRVLPSKVKSKSHDVEEAVHSFTEFTDSLWRKDVYRHLSSCLYTPHPSLPPESLGKIGKMPPHPRSVCRFSVYSARLNGGKVSVAERLNPVSAVEVAA